MAPHTIAGSHPRRDVPRRRDRPRPTWRSIPGRPRLRAPSGRGMPGTAPQDTTPVAARLATCRGNTFGPAIRLSSTGFDGDHQAWRNIDGGTEEVPGGTAGAVDPDDGGSPSGPGVASQRVPADR